MPEQERLYIVAYDIRDPRRWRGVFKTMRGYGEWLQLSMFQCRLPQMRHAEMIADLDQLIHHDDDHVLVMDLGPAESVAPRVTSLGKGFEAVGKGAIVV